MRALRSRLAALDPYLLVPLALGVLLFSPLFARGLPVTADGMLHLYRTALWSDAWAQGDFWPRWHTALYQGYGYPLFNFYAPLLYIAGGLLHFVLPSAEAALKGVLLLICIGYPLGMYLWARDIFSRLAAIVAAAAFAFAAYRFRELFIQGNYAQLLAWGIYPWLFWTWRRLAWRGSRSAFAGAVISLAALLLAHNISAMLVAPFAAAYVVWQAVAARAARPWPRLIGAAACAGLIGLAFWLPALTETEYVRVHVLTQGYFDVAGHFIRLRELLAATPLLDGRAANPTPPFNAGCLSLALALIGALGIARPGATRAQRSHLIFALSGALLAGFLMLAPSLAIWRAVPYIAFAEFPTRLYGVGILCTALLAGAALEWLARWPRLHALGGILCIFALILMTINAQLPRTFVPIKAATAGLAGYEVDYRAPGTTSADEYLSIWMRALPADAAVSKEGERRALVNPPAGMAGTITRVTPTTFALTIDAAAAGTAPIAQFYFPGWRATVNGAPVAVAPYSDAGLIGVPVAAGRSAVELVYAGTPTQCVAGWLGIAGLLATALALIFGFRRPAAPAPPLAPAPRGPAYAAAALVGVIALIKTLWIAPHTELFRVTSPAGAALPAQHAASVAVAPDVRLIGWDIEQTSAPQGGAFHVRLYWQGYAPIEQNYSSFVQLIGGLDQTEFDGSTAMHPGGAPTSSWNSDFYVVDDHEIPVAPDTPPMRYTLRVGLTLQGAQARVGETDLSPQVYVTPRTPVRTAEIAHRLDAAFGQTATLLGYDSQLAGDALTLTLYWQPGAAPPPNQQLFIHVLDGAGGLLAQRDGAPFDNAYPPDAWLRGAIVRDARTIALSPGAAPTSVLVGIYDLTTLARTPVSGGAAGAGDAVVINLQHAD